MNKLTADISGYLLKLKDAISNLNINDINQFLNILLEARNKGKQIFIMGNGGSAATASHFACDFNKGASYGFENQKRFKFICLNDNIASLMAYANDVSYEEIFVEQLKNFFNPGDVVIGISGSGNSANILKAVEYANKNNGITIALTGYNGGKLKTIAQYGIHVNIDDMQIVEDLHMVMDHLSMRVITENYQQTES
jgi:D-sedoheptulose 7-phosphate isomerase